MKKKILSTALALIMSTGMIVSNVVGVSAAGTKDYTINFVPIQQSEFCSPNGYIGNDFDYVYVKTETGSDKDYTDYHYEILIVPKGNIAKVCYTGSKFKVLSSNSKNAGLAYSYDISVSKKISNLCVKRNLSGLSSANYISFEANKNAEIGMKGVNVFRNGDVNTDYAINVTDIEKIAAHIKSKRILNNQELFMADVNGDNNVNVTDTVLIAAHIKGKNRIN